MKTLKVLDKDLELYAVKVNGSLIKNNTKSEWLPLDFEDRTISWVKNRINFKIQIYPTIDHNEIIGWNFWSVAWKDKSGKRFWLQRFRLKNESKEIIVQNFNELANSEIEYLDKINEDDLILVSD